MAYEGKSSEMSGVDTASSKLDFQALLTGCIETPQNIKKLPSTKPTPSLKEGEDDKKTVKSITLLESSSSYLPVKEGKTEMGDLKSATVKDYSKKTEKEEQESTKAAQETPVPSIALVPPVLQKGETQTSDVAINEKSQPMEKVVQERVASNDNATTLNLPTNAQTQDFNAEKLSAHEKTFTSLLETQSVKADIESSVVKNHLLGMNNHEMESVSIIANTDEGLVKVTTTLNEGGAKGEKTLSIVLEGNNLPTHIPLVNDGDSVKAMFAGMSANLSFQRKEVVPQMPSLKRKAQDKYENTTAEVSRGGGRGLLETWA